MSVTATAAPVTRSIATIASEIRRDWKKVHFGAVPYLEAMGVMRAITDDFGCDPGTEIVIRFLLNASTWRGDVARRVKAELRGLVDA